MTENLMPDKYQKKPSKRERRKIQKNIRQHEIGKEMIKRVWKSFLYFSPVLIGFMMFAVSLSLGCFIAGFSGVIVAVKQEAPSGRGTIRGKWAIALGVIYALFFWAMAAYFFWVELTIKWWRF